MNKYLKIIIFCVLAIASTAITPGYSQENLPDSPSNKPELKWMYGSVSQVSFVKAFLLLFTDMGYLPVAVPDNTTILIGGQKADLDEIKTEDSVRIQYYCPKPGKYVAVTISKTKETNQ